MSPNQVAYVDSTGSGIETISHIYENRRCTLMFTSFTRYCRILRLFCTGRVIERDSPDFKVWIDKMAAKGMRVEQPDPKQREKLAASDGDANFDPEREGNGVIGARAVVVLDVWKVQHSCGYGVPLLAGNPGTGDLEEAEEKEDGKQRSGANVSAGKNAVRSEDPNDTNSVKFDDTWDDRNVLVQFATNALKKNQIRGYRVKNNTESLDFVPGLEMAIRDSGRNVKTVRFEAWMRKVFLAEQQALIVGVLLGLFLALAAQRVMIRISG